MEKLDSIIASNLTYLRKKAKLTQLEFGEKFNYSDKTVSKWELGNVIPSVEILKEIADFYGVSVDYILTEHLSQKKFDSEISKVVNPREKIIFIALAVTVAWCIAAVVYATGYLQHLNWWPAFIWSVPASFLIIAYFTRRFFKKSIWPLIFLSCFVWSLLASVFIQMLIIKDNYWFLFILGIPLQALLILLMTLKKSE